MLVILIMAAVAPVAAVGVSAALRGRMPKTAANACGLARHPAVVVAAVMSLTATLVTISWPAAAQVGETHVFSGTVTANDGAALSNMKVSVFCQNCPDGSTSDPSADPARPWPATRWGDGAQLLGEATTGASGEWSVAVAEPPSGDPLVVAWDPAGDYAFSTILSWESWTDHSGIDASLADGGMLSGRILADGAAPSIAGFTLGGYGDNLLWSGISLVVAANGNYRTPGLPDGDYNVTYPDDLGQPYITGASFSLGTISGGQDSVTDHHLVKYTSLSGTVTDGSGKGLSGIQVVASGVGSSPSAGLLASPFGGWLDPVETGDDGTYVFDSVVPGSVVWELWFISLDGEYASEIYDNNDAEPVAIPRVGATGIDAQLGPGGTISGHVRDLDGQPVRYVGINVCPEQGRYYCGRDSTDDSGYFEIDGLAAASYRVIAYPEYPLPSVEESVVLGEGGHEQVDFQVGFRGAFVDDEGAFYEAPFDALSERGIFAGTECNASQICPEDPITRATLAVWLGRALTGEEPPSIQSSRFTDVASRNWQAAHIERFAELGVTSGCGDGTRFCPYEAVNRGQMAAFLVRAFELPDASSAGFDDTGGHFFEGEIDALAAARITHGCRTDRLSYCPNQPVTRGQMATFIARALELA